MLVASSRQECRCLFLAALLCELLVAIVPSSYLCLTQRRRRRSDCKISTVNARHCVIELPTYCFFNRSPAVWMLIGLHPLAAILTFMATVYTSASAGCGAFIVSIQTRRRSR